MLAAGCAAIAFVTVYWLYFPPLFLVCLVLPVVNSALGGYNAAITPRAIIGRAASIGRLSTRLVQPLAPIVGAWLLERLGVNGAAIVFAALMACFVAAIAANPVLRRIGKPDTWAADAVRLGAEPPMDESTEVSNGPRRDGDPDAD